MLLFLVSGRARSGKTLIANIIKKELETKGYKAVITEYSKYIKLFAKELLGWDGITEPKPRKFLQDTGTFVRKYYSDIFFTERMKEDLKIYKEFVDAVIISDVRMPKEITSMEEYKPITIRVINKHSNYDLTKEEASHETEHALDDYKKFAYTLEELNEEELKNKIIEILKEKEL